MTGGAKARGTGGRSDGRGTQVPDRMAEMRESLKAARGTAGLFERLADGAERLRRAAREELSRYAMAVRTASIDGGELDGFFGHPYVILPGNREGEYRLVIPRFIDAQFGWLEKVTPGYNIFLVNRYVDWLGGLPQALKDELGFPEPLDVRLEGDRLTGSQTDEAYRRYRKFVRRREGDGSLRVSRKRHFELLAALIRDGVLPFVPRPVDESDMIRRRCDFELRDYQREIFGKFLRYSNVGAFLPPGTGKTYLGMHAMTHVRGPWLVLAPSRLLAEQWTERIGLYTDLKTGEDVDVATYHSAIRRRGGREYRGKIIDEVHHMPSNEFSRMAAIQTAYTIGLSATPQREDGREEYIFALTGMPTGMDWQTFKRAGIIASPQLHVWIVGGERERMERVTDLTDGPAKTIIFADSIDMGRRYAARLGVPHVHGASRGRLDVIRDSRVTVVSRVGDEGVSLPDIERVIEISWLHGSRRQELQRFTRLLHGSGNRGEGHIIMTAAEYEADRKRLYGIMDRGFKIVVHGNARSAVSRSARHRAVGSASPKAQAAGGGDAVRDGTRNAGDTRRVPSLPGLQKITAQTSRAEARLVEFLVQSEGRKYTKRGLALRLGYSSVAGMGRVDMRKLQRLGLVSVRDGMYMADPGLLGRASG